jgi:hypothetical protein
VSLKTGHIHNLRLRSVLSGIRSSLRLNRLSCPSLGTLVISAILAKLSSQQTTMQPYRSESRNRHIPRLPVCHKFEPLLTNHDKRARASLDSSKEHFQLTVPVRSDQPRLFLRANERCPIPREIRLLRSAITLFRTVWVAQDCSED